MAESQDERSSEDLTDEISQHRLEEYRRKGIVVQSRELSAMAALLATVCSIYALSPHLGTQLIDYMRDAFKAELSPQLDMGAQNVLRIYLLKAAKVLISVSLPVCLAGFVFGALASFVQVGAVFTFEPLMPDFGKVDPIQGFKRLFSIKHMIDGIRIVLKLIIILFVIYVLVKNEVFSSASYVGSEPSLLFFHYGRIGKAIFFPLFGILIIFAGLDYGFQRFEYYKNLRMTKQEAKQENKEREGDPHIKARIRSIQREIARRRMMQSVKTADVVITNPTHFAVALVYDKKKMSAPRVVAKGADFIAQQIKKIAAESSIPMVENVPLARALYKSVKIGQAIPKVLYQAVAEVLAYVYRLKMRNL